MYYILFLVSLALYFSTSYGIDDSKNICAFILFLICALLLCKDRFKKKQFLFFNSIFLFSFFFVSYCTPLFVLGTPNEISMFALHLVDVNYATQATAMCSVAICAYCIGYGDDKSSLLIQPHNRIEYTPSLKVFLDVLLIITALVFLANVALVIVQRGMNIIAITERPFIMELFKVCLILNCVVHTMSVRKDAGKSLRSLMKHNFLSLVISMPIMLFFLYLGDRGLALVILMTYTGAYILYYGRIRFVSLILAGAIGVASMFIIRSTRTSEASLKNSNIAEFTENAQSLVTDNSVLFMFSDLYGISQELYLGFEYKHKKGLFYPEQAVIIPFYPIPLVPTFLSTQLFDKTHGELSPAMELNNYASTETYVTHFGDHIVSNVYMRWGLLGVVICFFLFGKSVGWLEQNKLSSIVLSSLYLYTFAHAIYLPRSSMFDLIRPGAYIWLLVFIGMHISSIRTIIKR